MRLNKYLITFTGLFAGVSLMIFVVLQKYFLLLLHHTIYYCKEMAETLAVRFPGGTGIIVFAIISIILTIVTAAILLKVDLSKIAKRVLKKLGWVKNGKHSEDHVQK